MRLVFSTDSFVYAGRPRPGLPIMLGDDMWPLQPAQEFLIHRLLGKGKALSRLTWEDYGRRLWDYFAFLHGHGIKWDDCSVNHGQGPIARYKTWSLAEVGVSRRTLNARLRLVIEFYTWAFKHGHIQTLPFGFEVCRAYKGEHLLAHAVDPGAVLERPDVFEREWSAPPDFLALEEIAACRASAALRRAGPRLLFDLMWRTGLRSCEARTFPLKYVFDPSRRNDCHRGRMIRLTLDPRDMWIKFGKPRQVDIPYSLMQDMHAYTLYERNRLRSVSTQEHAALVLTEYGRPYSRNAVGDMMRAVSAQIGSGFRVTALMLRHSYAVHTLARLRSVPDFKGEPLLYVRDRLGHADVTTTAIYLGQLNQLASGVVIAIEDEFDRMFEVPAVTQ